jgi:HK97 family phage portal protein
MLASMALRLRAEGDSPRPADDFWYGPAGGVSLAGQIVSVESALRNATVYACWRLLAETIASLPLIVYRERKGGGKDRATDHPLYSLLHDQPNARHTSLEFRELQMFQALSDGNAYAQIVRGMGGGIGTLDPLVSNRMTPELLPNGRVRFKYLDPSGQQTILVQDEVFRVMGPSLNGVQGMNPIQYHRETLGLAAAQTDYLARFYRNDARPGGVIEWPGSFKSLLEHDEFRKRWQESQTGANRQKTAILQSGMAYKEIGLKHTDAQFLESMKYTRADIARIFRVPPHKVGELDKATFSNIEHQSLEFTTDTILPWCRRWEAAIKRDLIAEDNVFAEFLLDGLLRGDSTARQNFYREALTDGWMTPNEVRDLENRNPLPGLDEPRQPLNMGQVGDTPVPSSPGPARAANLGAPKPGAGTPAAQFQRLLDITRGAARRALEREKGTLRTLAKRTANDAAAFAERLAEEYREQAAYLIRGLCLSEAQARAYCDAQREAVAKGGMALVETWGEPEITRLVNLALEGGTNE